MTQENKQSRCVSQRSGRAEASQSAEEEMNSLKPRDDDLSDIDDESTEEVNKDALERLALRARLRQEARAASSSAAAAKPATSAQMWGAELVALHREPQRDESSADEDEDKEEDVGAFSLPPAGRPYLPPAHARTHGPTVRRRWER